MTPRIVRRRQWDIANRKRRDAGRLVRYTVFFADPEIIGDLTYRPRRLYIEMHRNDADHLRISPHGSVSLAGPEKKAGRWIRGRDKWLRVYLSPDTTPEWVARLVWVEEKKP